MLLFLGEGTVMINLRNTYNRMLRTLVCVLFIEYVLVHVTHSQSRSHKCADESSDSLVADKNNLIYEVLRLRSRAVFSLLSRVAVVVIRLELPTMITIIVL